MSHRMGRIQLFIMWATYKMTKLKWSVYYKNAKHLHLVNKQYAAVLLNASFNSRQSLFLYSHQLFCHLPEFRIDLVYLLHHVWLAGHDFSQWLSFEGFMWDIWQKITKEVTCTEKQVKIRLWPGPSPNFNQIITRFLWTLKKKILLPIHFAWANRVNKDWRWFVTDWVTC